MHRKALVCAYACNPWQGSEHGVGWGWLRSIAQEHEVHALVGDCYNRHGFVCVSRNNAWCEGSEDDTCAQW